MAITIATLKALLTLDVSDFTSNADKAEKAADGLGSQFGSKLKGNLEAFGKVGMVALGSTAAAAGGLLGYGVKIAADMEQAKIGFTTMLGSAEKADSFIRDLQAFAAKTPFEFAGLQESASKLLAVGVNAERVIPLMTVLGDATSAVGTGAEGIDRAVMALTQMQQKGKVTGEEMLQLVEAGVPAWDALAAKMGVDVATAQDKVSKGQVKVNDLFAALEGRAGPALQRVSGMMDQQSQSFTGILSSLKDTFDQQLANLAGPLMESLKGALPTIQDFLDRGIKAITPPLQEATMAATNFFNAIVTGEVEIGGQHAVLDWAQQAGGAVHDAFTWLLEHKEIIIGSVAAIGAAWAASMALAAAETIAATWPLVALIAVVGGLVAAVVWLYNNWQFFHDVVSTAIDWLKTNGPQAFEAVKQAVTTFAEALAPLISYISDNREQLERVGRVLLVVGGIVLGVVVAGLLVMAAVFITAAAAAVVLVTAAVAVVAALYNVAQVLWDVFNNVRDALGTAWEAIENFIGAIPERLGAFVDIVESFFVALPGRIAAALAALPGVVWLAIVTVFDWATTETGRAVGKVVQFFIDLPGQLMAAAGALWAAVVAIWGFVRDTSIQHAQMMVAGTVDWFSQLPGRAAGALSFLWGAISGAFFAAKDQSIAQTSSLVQGVIGFLASTPSRAAGALSGFAGAVSGALSSAISGARSVGEAIMRGVGDGIQNMIGWAKGVAQRAAENIVNGFKSALHISSPSKVMADEVGRWIPAGIGKGIERGEKDLHRSVIRLVQSTIAVAQHQFGLADAAGELLAHLQAGGGLFEDFSFTGMSDAYAGFTEQLANMFWANNAGRDWGAGGWETGAATSFAQGLMSRPGPPSQQPMTVEFAGDVDSAFASAFMRLQREGKIQIRAA